MADKFQGSNKAEWQELIEKSSKGKAYDSFSKELDGLQIMAFNMANDVLHTGATKKTDSGWKIGVDFAKLEPKELNKAILQFLNIGAEAISIPLDRTEDLAEIYASVHADWIHNDIRVEQDISLTDLQDFFPPESSISLSSKAEKTNSANYISIRPKNKTSHAEQIAEILDLAEQLKAQGTSLENILIHVNTHVYMPIHVSFLRAIRIVWANYMLANKIKTYSIKIAAHIISEESDKDIQLIEQCVSSMNAAMGGADFIFLDASAADNNYERLSLQIQNVMKMESKMALAVDVFNGSFAIENLTNTLAEKAWNLAAQAIG